MSVWDQIADVLNSGKAVSISVPLSSERTIKSRLTRGRPCVRDMENPYMHYRTSKKGRSRPRCIVCKKLLKINDVEVCSEVCREQAEEWLKSKLSSIKNSGIEIPITKNTAKHIMENFI